MLGGLERLLGRNGNGHIARDIFHLMNSAANPRELAQLHKFLFEAVIYELRNPCGMRDCSHIFKEIEKNKKLIKKGMLRDEHPNALLILLGYLENWRSGLDYLGVLRDNGIAHAYILPAYHFCDLATNADYFLDTAECICRETGKEKTDVISHSRGGLITTYAAATRPDQLRKFGKIITVGAPHHGTFIANLAYYLFMGRLGERLLKRTGYDIEPIREMVYCSEKTEILSEDLKKKNISDVDFYSIFSLRHDEAIIPGECSIVDSSNFVNINIDDYLHTGRIGHAGLISNQDVIDLELQILKGRFDKNKFMQQSPIITFEEYRREREGKRYQERKPAEDNGNNGLTPEALNMMLNLA